ncbi:MAG TPA: hypothetical protein VLX31_08865 [Streptosporangiaceae bacterium]|nr:hypothetical protein [Streptosporangiaceae bacterium]
MSQSSGDSWERRAAGLAGDVQRWLIRKSAQNMRDELGDQVKKALRGPQPDNKNSKKDVWATATTERPRPITEAPECAWCPVCRAARRVAEARAAGDVRGAAAQVSELSDVVAGAVADVLAGLDSVLSYRPGESGATRAGSGQRDAARSAPDRPTPAGPAPDEPAPGELADDDQGWSAWDKPSTSRPGDDRAEEPEDEPGHRG